MSGTVTVTGRKTKHAAIRAVVHRADGTVEDHGLISYYHRNPLRRLLWQLSRPFRRVRIIAPAR